MFLPTWFPSNHGSSTIDRYILLLWFDPLSHANHKSGLVLANPPTRGWQWSFSNEWRGHATGGSPRSWHKRDDEHLDVFDFSPTAAARESSF